MRVSIALVLASLAAALPAQRELRSLRSSPGVLAAFTGVVAAARSSTAVVQVAGEVVALGLVVRKDGLVLTKASEIGAGDVRCTVAGADLPAHRRARDEVNDLLLLQVELAGGAELAVPRWADAVPSRGAWLATVGPGPEPVAVGILSSAPYRLSSRRAFLGVQLHVDSSPPRIQVVMPDSAAAAAGLRPEDTLLAVDGVVFASVDRLIAAIGKHDPGERIHLRVQREDGEVELVAQLRQDHRIDHSSQERIWGPLSSVRSGFGVVLQHDTVLRPDQCGGPLVDLDGEVVGLNIARAGRVETLALPHATVEAALRRMLAPARGQERGRDR